MNFFSSTTPEHSHYLLGGGASHEGIIYDHDPFAFYNRSVWAQFHEYPQISKLLSRFYETPPNVVVSYKTELKGKTPFFGIPERRHESRIGHGYHYIRLNIVLPRKLSPEFLPHPINPITEDKAIGSGKVY